MGIFSKKPTGSIPSTRAGRVIDDAKRDVRKKDELAEKRAKKNQDGKK